MSVNLGIENINLFFSLITNLDTKEIDNFFVKHGFNYATSLNNNNDTSLHFLLLNYDNTSDNINFYKLFDYLLNFFIENNISLNLKNNSGQTILELALKFKDDYLVSKLINSNLCSLNIKNNENIPNSFFIFNSENICDKNIIENIIKLDKDNTLLNVYPEKDVFEDHEIKEDIYKLINFNKNYKTENFKQFYNKIILLKNKNNFVNLDYYFTLKNKNINLSCWLYNQQIFIDCFKKDINILYYSDNNKNTPLHHLFKYQKWEILEKINLYLSKLPDQKKKIVKNKILNILNNVYNNNNYLIPNILYYNLDDFLKKFKNLDDLKYNLKLDYIKILISKIYNNSSLGNNILKDIVENHFYFEEIIDYYTNKEFKIFEDDKLILKILNKILKIINHNNSEEKYENLEKFINKDSNKDINSLIKNFYESLIVKKKYIISSIPFDLSGIPPEIGIYIYKIFYIYNINFKKLEKNNNEIILHINNNNYTFEFNNDIYNDEVFQDIIKTPKINYENYFSNRNFLIMYNVLHEYLLQLNNLFIAVLNNFKQNTENITTINYLKYDSFIKTNYNDLDNKKYTYLKKKFNLYLDVNNKFNTKLYNQIKEDINITTLKTFNFINLFNNIKNNLIPKQLNISDISDFFIKIDKIDLTNFLDKYDNYIYLENKILEWNKTSCEINNNILLLLYYKNFKKLNFDRNNFYYELAQYVNEEESYRNTASKFMPLFIDLIKNHLENLNRDKKYFEYKLDPENDIHINIVCNVITGGNYVPDLSNPDDNLVYDNSKPSALTPMVGSAPTIRKYPVDIEDDFIRKQYNIFYYYSDINNLTSERRGGLYANNEEYAYDNRTNPFNRDINTFPYIFETIKDSSSGKKLDIHKNIKKIFRNLNLEEESGRAAVIDLAQTKRREEEQEAKIEAEYKNFDDTTKFYARKFIDTWNESHDEYILINNYEYKNFLQFSLNNNLVVNSNLEKNIDNFTFKSDDDDYNLLNTVELNNRLSKKNIVYENLSKRDKIILLVNNPFLKEDFDITYDYNTFFEKKLHSFYNFGFGKDETLNFRYQYTDEKKLPTTLSKLNYEMHGANEKFEENLNFYEKKINEEIYYFQEQFFPFNMPYNLYVPKDFFYIIIKFIIEELNILNTEIKENWEYYNQFFLNNKELNKENKNILFLAYLIINYDINDDNYLTKYNSNSNFKVYNNIFYKFFEYIEKEYFNDDIESNFIGSYYDAKILPIPKLSKIFDERTRYFILYKIYFKIIIFYSCSEKENLKENIFYKFLKEELRDKFQIYKQSAFDDENNSIIFLKNKLLDSLSIINYNILNNNFPLSAPKLTDLFKKDIFKNIYDTHILSEIIKNNGYGEENTLNNQSIDDIYNVIKNNIRNSIIKTNSKFIYDNNLLHFKFSNLEIIQNNLNIQLENILIYISDLLDIILENPQNLINQILILYKNLFNLVKTYTEYKKLKNL